MSPLDILELVGWLAAVPLGAVMLSHGWRR